MGTPTTDFGPAAAEYHKSAFRQVDFASLGSVETWSKILFRLVPTKPLSSKRTYQRHPNAKKKIFATRTRPVLWLFFAVHAYGARAAGFEAGFSGEFGGA